MEQLTKQQLILLALLVSFVTSIATGIVTVSLVNQAPPQMTQTINRVVEKTIERVVPAAPAQGAAVVTTKETVVVKADDLVVEAIERGVKSLVRIRKTLGVGAGARTTLVSLGTAISKEGLIVADARAMAPDLDEFGAPIPRTFAAELSGGERIDLTVIGIDAETDVGLFKPAPGAPAADLAPATFANSEAVKLGQTVIALDGESDNSVSVGIVSALVKREPAGEKPVTVVKSDKAAAPGKVSYLIKTDVRTDAVPGSLLFTLSGDLVGFRVGAFPERGAYLASSVVSEAVARIERAAAGTR